jgi:hypothetical protein
LPPAACAASWSSGVWHGQDVSVRACSAPFRNVYLLSFRASPDSLQYHPGGRARI